jgi:hypothetical protein
MNVPSQFKPGKKTTIELLVKNISPAEWPAVGEPDGRYTVKLATRWRDKTGTVLTEQSQMKHLPYDVDPATQLGCRSR